MATSDMPASTTLSKAARSGVAKSRPAVPPALSDTSALDAVFAQETASAGARAETPPKGAHPAAPEQIVVAPPAAASGDIFARLTRGNAGGEHQSSQRAAPSTPVQVDDAPREGATPPAAPNGAAVDAGPGAASSVFDRIARVADDGGASLKKAMAGAKVLTPLVAAVSFAPGSARPPAERRAALAATLLATERVADRVAGTFTQTSGKPVPQWIKTQLMTAIGEQVAKRVEKRRSALTEAEIQGFAEDLSLISSEHAGLLREVVEGACNDAYHRCETQDDARSRLSVTFASCAWKMYDWVTHDCLSLDPKGEHPSCFFTFGQRADEIVQELLRAAVDQASTFVVNPQDSDLRVSHMQNSINRFTNLIGSEYVTRTRAIMNWIGEPGLPATEAVARRRQACERFPIETLPRIVEYARSTFVYIENGAAQVADGLYDALLNEPINKESHAT
ncbi:MAG: hypothetical protein K0Q43_48 [Ramlibacter sp.]|jgi:hypothetical protein|nr:hypothetical protein [Ramlibacter sp.]